MHHMDALEFLGDSEICPDGYFDVCLFDPPFSPRQAEEKYRIGHVNVYTEPLYVHNCMHQIFRTLKPGGKLLKLGYNSTRHHQGFDLLEGWIVNFGGNRNDVIMTLWRKNTMTLGNWGV